MPPTFYLGTHRPNWLAQLEVLLFVSHRTLGTRRTLPRALGPWALDSGGFTEVSTYGRWTVGPAEYVAAVRRYCDEVGGLDWASPQDWMCEPFILAKTGLTVADHQRLTIENYLDLRDLDATLPFVPVLQGWTPDDYLRHVDAYAAAGVDLPVLPRVGVGSVCRRQDTGTARRIFTRLAELGISSHGFGVKINGLRAYGDLLTSADSMAWSFRARRDASDRLAAGLVATSCGKRNCANCIHFAVDWRAKAVVAAETLVGEPTLFDLAW